MSGPGLDAWAAALEPLPAEEVLLQAAARFPRRLGFATGFGREGCVLVDLMARHGLDVDIFTLDTGVLFPETYALWKELEDRYGVAIRAVRAPAGDLDRIHRGWETDPDRCCELRKVIPLGLELTRFGAWVTAIRRDQTSDRRDARPVEWDGKFGLVKVNPLVRWTAADVDEYVARHGVPVNPLHEQGYPSIGCQPCTSPVEPGEDPRAGRWRGREKTECGLHSRPGWPASPVPPAPKE
jgi:phosphoadenylyl-sulfate reductase (thioredoxin)